MGATDIAVGIAIVPILAVGIFIFVRRRTGHGQPKMAFSRSVGLDLPSDFDVATYDALNDCAAAFANPNAEDAHSKNVAQVFAAAWLGVAFRLRAAFADDKEFRASITQAGVSPLPAERYIQECAFFGC